MDSIMYLTVLDLDLLALLAEELCVRRAGRLSLKNVTTALLSSYKGCSLLHHGLHTRHPARVPRSFSHVHSTAASPEAPAAAAAASLTLVGRAAAATFCFSY